jgi:hypothetical protein
MAPIFRVAKKKHLFSKRSAKPLDEFSVIMLFPDGRTLQDRRGPIFRAVPLFLIRQVVSPSGSFLIKHYRPNRYRNLVEI